MDGCLWGSFGRKAVSPRGTPRQPQADTHVEYVQQPLTYLQCEGNHCCGNVSESRIFLGPRFSNLSVKKTDGNIPTRTELNTVANRCDVFSTPFQTRNAEVFLYSVLLVTDRIFLFFFFFYLTSPADSAKSILHKTQFQLLTAAAGTSCQTAGQPATYFWN